MGNAPKLIPNESKLDIMTIAGVGLIALAIYHAAKSIGEISMPPSFKPVVMLDPGHEGVGNGLDPGACEFFVLNGQRYDVAEVDCNLAVAAACKKRLLERGISVLMTKEGYGRLTIEERAQLIELHKPHVFVSIHHDNVAGHQEVTRTTVLKSNETKLQDPVMNGLNKSLAQCIAEPVRKTIAMGRSGYEAKILTDTEGAGKRLGVLSACRRANIPGVLIETAFLTDRTWQRALITDPNLHVKAGKALADGIVDFIRNILKLDFIVAA